MTRYPLLASLIWTPISISVHDGVIKKSNLITIFIFFLYRFYVVSKRGGGQVSYNHVYSLAHLLKVIKLPATVQLVVGPKPRNYWPDSASDNGFDGVYQDKKFFGSFTRNGGRSRHNHSKSLSEATFTAVLRLEDIRVRRQHLLLSDFLFWTPTC